MERRKNLFHIISSFEYNWRKKIEIEYFWFKIELFCDTVNVYKLYYASNDQTWKYETYLGYTEDHSSSTFWEIFIPFSRKNDVGDNDCKC